MQLSVDKLGKVAVTVEKDYWNNLKDYNKLTIVEAPGNEYKTYISRKPVPAGTVLTDRNYWIPFSSLKEEIVLDFNSFVALWTENLTQTNVRIDNANTRIEEVNYSLLQKEHDLYLAIASVVQGGVALKQDFGDSEVFGISQKVLTERIDNIQDQIDRLHPGTFGLSITVTPNIVYIGEETNVSVVAKMANSEIADEIKLKIGSEIIASVNNANTLTTTITVNNATYLKAEATKQGLTYEGNGTVYGTKPYYVGSAAIYSDVYNNMYKQSIKLNPNGTYNVVVPTNGYKVYFIIPSNMTINRATMSGFEFPLDAPDTSLIEGYKVYVSSNTYDAGTLTIVIS